MEGDGVTLGDERRTFGGGGDSGSILLPQF